MIEKILETLTPPESWIKGAYAVTAKGYPIGPSCKHATCFCLLGAAERAEDRDLDSFSRGLTFIRASIREHFPHRSDGTQIAEFNDHPDTTHDDVLLVLRKARELEQAGAE